MTAFICYLIFYIKLLSRLFLLSILRAHFPVLRWSTFSTFLQPQHIEGLCPYLSLDFNSLFACVHVEVRRQLVGVGSLTLWTLTIVFRLPDSVAFTCQAISATCRNSFEYRRWIFFFYIDSLPSYMSVLYPLELELWTVANCSMGPGICIWVLWKLSNL